ncbi:MAG: hypothetical protein ABEJ03_05520 [Candidatus Nanohaloarchaea archaeon]
MSQEEHGTDPRSLAEELDTVQYVASPEDGYGTNIPDQVSGPESPFGDMNNYDPAL